MSKVEESMSIPYYLDSDNSMRTYSSFKALVQQNKYRYNSTKTTGEQLSPLWSVTPEPDLLTSTVVSFNRGCQPCSNTTIYDVLTYTVATYWEESDYELIGTDDDLRLVRAAPPSTKFHIPRNARPIAVDWGSIPDLNSAKFTETLTETLPSPYNSITRPLAMSLASIISESAGHSGSPSYYLNIDSKAQFPIAKFTRGYGYGASPASTRLSLIVITTYCIVATAYIAYLLVSGYASTAWNSATELVLLALQSRYVHHLGYTYVGINSKETYREPVGIRVSGGKRLELVSANDPSIRARKLRRVVPNKAY
jgi:hypothetical protein